MFAEYSVKSAICVKLFAIGALGMLLPGGGVAGSFGLLLVTDPLIAVQLVVPSLTSLTESLASPSTNIETAPLPNWSTALGSCSARFSTDCVVSTAAHTVHDRDEYLNPNVVKVVLDARGLAMYFSRAPIPWWRDRFGDGIAALPPGPALRHIGIYGYRARFLRALRPCLTLLEFG